MYIFRKTADLERYLKRQKENGLKSAFVPTMGALHEGHFSLLAIAQEESDFSIVSIFVNPTQFDDKKDLEKYPRKDEEDIRALVTRGCDVLYLPSPEEVYPPDSHIKSDFDLGGLDRPMEGAHRPGHFNGVVQVVNRLLEIVQPSSIIMGQKDYQQAAIIRRLLEVTESETELVVAPIIREEDGLAMSSRNVRLSESERKVAPKIQETLQWVKAQKGKKPLELVLKEAVAKINEGNQLRVDYLEMANAQSLEVVKNWEDSEALVLCTAVHLGPVRLIDNVLI